MIIKSFDITHAITIIIGIELLSVMITLFFLLLLQYVGDISTVVYYRSWGPSVDSDNLHHLTILYVHLSSLYVV